MTKSAELSLPRWLLPAELADTDGRRRRTVRDWLVDLALFGFAVFVGLAELGQPEARIDVISDSHLLLDMAVGLAACLTLWWRRRIPLILLWLMIPAQLAWSASGAVFVTVLTAALHRPWRPVVLAVAVHLVIFLPAVAYFDISEDPAEIVVLAAGLFYLVPMLWGMTMRARRQLVVSLQREQDQKLEGARQAERRRIAREMHDTLAHRLSLVSVHAGALAYRTGTDPTGLDAAEVREATAIIQDSAQRAVVELGEVLTVLRAADEAEIPAADTSPRVDIEELAAEARTTGQPVTVVFDGDAAALDRLAVRGRRTVHRVVQEALTNARKHAPDQPVTVTVAIAETGVGVEVVNPLPAVAVRGADGFGLGLTGLAERVDVDGGSLEHESRHGRFRLRARLPWTP